MCVHIFSESYISNENAGQCILDCAIGLLGSRIMAVFVKEKCRKRASWSEEVWILLGPRRHSASWKKPSTKVGYGCLNDCQIDKDLSMDPR